MAPENLIYATGPEGVSDRAFRLWCVLARHAYMPLGAVPGRERLAGLLDCSVSSIDRAIKELEAAGYLVAHRRAKVLGEYRYAVEVLKHPSATHEYELYPGGDAPTLLDRGEPDGPTAGDFLPGFAPTLVTGDAPPLVTRDEPPLVTGDARSERDSQRENTHTAQSAYDEQPDPEPEPPPGASPWEEFIHRGVTPQDFEFALREAAEAAAGTAYARGILTDIAKDRERGEDPYRGARGRRRRALGLAPPADTDGAHWRGHPGGTGEGRTRTRPSAECTQPEWNGGRPPGWTPERAAARGPLTPVIPPWMAELRAQTGQVTP
jgi:Helix-turn-helix domain